MSDDVVMKVSQRRAVTVSAARRDPIASAGLDYIGGPKNVLDMSRMPKRPDENEDVRGLYTPPGDENVPKNLRNRAFIDYQRSGKNAERNTAHELSHAAARRFWDDVESENLSPSVDEKLGMIDTDSIPLHQGDAEEARNRMLDQKRNIGGSLDQTLEDFQFVRDHTHKGFNEGDTGERFHAARDRELDLMHLNDVMEEHFAKYGGGK